MKIAIFSWFMVIVLASFFLWSYLVWSPRTKSPLAIAVEVMQMTSQVAYGVGLFSLIWWGTLSAFWLGHRLGAL